MRRATIDPLAVIRSMQVVAPVLGEDEATAGDLAALAAVVGLRVERRRYHAAARLFPAFGSVPATLVMDEGLTPAQSAATIIQHVAALWPGASLSAADVDAIAGFALFHGRGLDADADGSWSSSIVRELIARPEILSALDLPTLLRAIETLHARSEADRVCEDAERVGEGARQAFERAVLRRTAADLLGACEGFATAVRLGRAAHRWDVVVSAQIGLGKCAAQEGAHARARRLLRRAAREARLNEQRQLEATAYHELFSVAVEAGWIRQAVRLAEATAATYVPSDPGLQRFAHDLADFWVRCGRYAAALPIAREAVGHFVAAADRATVLGTVAWAAGGAGDAAAYEDARVEIERSAMREGEGEDLAEALLYAARGGVLNGRVHEAERLAKWAYTAAARRGERRVVAEAGALLDALAIGEGRRFLVRDPGQEMTAARQGRLAESVLSALRQRQVRIA